MNFLWLYKESEQGTEQATNLSSLNFYQKSIADQLLEKKQTLTSFARAKELGSGHYFQTVLQYSAHVVKSKTAFFIVICNQPLTTSNLAHLTFNLLTRNVKLTDVIANPDNYTKDQKIAALRKQTEETKEATLAALDKLLDRGERLDTLLEHTEGLAHDCQDFQRAAEELNSCWPWSCSIL